MFSQFGKVWTGSSTVARTGVAGINAVYPGEPSACNQGNVTLEGYENLLQYVNSGQLLGAIRHDNGYSPMPQSGGKLSDCNISLFEIWVAEGALDN